MDFSTVCEKRNGIAQSRESRFQVTVTRLKMFSAMKRTRLSTWWEEQSQSSVPGSPKSGASFLPCAKA